MRFIQINFKYSRLSILLYQIRQIKKASRLMQQEVKILNESQPIYRHLIFTLQKPLVVWPCCICMKNIIKMTVFVDQKCQKMYCLSCFMTSFPGNRYYILKKGFLETQIEKIGSVEAALETYRMLIKDLVEQQIMNEDSLYYSLNRNVFQDENMSLFKKDKQTDDEHILQQEMSDFIQSSSIKRQHINDIYAFQKQKALKQLSYNLKRQEFTHLPPNVYELLLAENQNDDQQETKLLLQAYFQQKKARDDAEKYLIQSDFLIKKEKIPYSNQSKCNESKRCIRENILQSKEIQSYSKPILEMIQEMVKLDAFKNQISDPNHDIQRKAQQYYELTIDKGSLRSSKK